MMKTQLEQVLRENEELKRNEAIQSHAAAANKKRSHVNAVDHKQNKGTKW